MHKFDVNPTPFFHSVTALTRLTHWVFTRWRNNRSIGIGHFFTNPTPISFTSSSRTASTDLCLHRFFWATRFLILIFSLFFVSGPCARLSWPSRQLLSARKSTVSYRIVSYHCEQGCRRVVLGQGQSPSNQPRQMLTDFQNNFLLYVEYLDITKTAWSVRCILYVYCNVA